MITSRSGARRICFYITDHGYGHAARDIAVIRALIEASARIEILVRAHVAATFLRQALSVERVRLFPRRNDFGFTNSSRGRPVVNRERTEIRLKRWVAAWPDYVREETLFCRRRGVDLIVSDVVAQAFLVAKAADIPSVAVSDFDWHWFYRRLFGDTPETKAVGEAYRNAHMALILPLGPRLDIFPRQREVALVARKRTRSRQEVRRQLGVPDREFVVHLGLGQSVDPSFLEAGGARPCEGNAKVLVSWNVSLPGAIQIPRDDPESQDYLGACDLVVSKAGYSTVAEAIAARIPMLLFHNSPESERVLHSVTELGVGRELTWEALLDGGWLTHIASLDGYLAAFARLPERLTRDGNVEAATAILEVLGRTA